MCERAPGWRLATIGPVRRLIGVGILFAVLASAAGAAPSPFRSSTSINDSAKLSGGGLSIRITGHVSCPTNYRFAITLLVVQPTTGAYAAATFPGQLPAAGSARAAIYRRTICSGSKTTRSWAVLATSRGKVPRVFRIGSAEVCLLARFRSASTGRWLGVSSTCQAINVS